MRVVSLTAAVLAWAALLSVVRGDGLSFASIGDWGCVPIGGWHEQDELIVAKNFAAAAAKIDAQFVLNTGDAFYYCGVHNTTDPMWAATFENVYNEKSMMVDWWGCLGNHDYGYPGSAEAEMNYKSPNNDRWHIPDRYYYKRFTYPGKVNISLVVLDASPCQSDYISSNPAGWDPCGSVIPSCPGCTFHENVIKQNCKDQLTFLNRVIPTIPAGDWKIAMVHAPASDLDVADFITPLQQAGFNLFLNGHVHLMAHYQMDNKGTYITTGGGCMVRVPDTAAKLGYAEPARKSLKMLGATSCTDRLAGHSCQIVWQDVVAGFTTHTFSDDYQSLTTYIYDYSGALLHTAVTQKNSTGPVPPSPPGPSSPPSPAGSCCWYHDSSCSAGQTCCDDKGRTYSQSVCDSYNGQKHNCKWTGSACVVQ